MRLPRWVEFGSVDADESQEPVRMKIFVAKINRSRRIQVG